jgi:DHA2 family multidrug resistance protein
MSPTAATPGGFNPWVIALVVTSAAFMEVLDTTIVNVSLPHIAGDLSAGVDESTWTLTSYLVANGIVLPISGWLSDIFGRKRFFIICILGFTAASMLCGLSTSLGMLVVMRVLQGLFGGGLQPSQQAILLDTFPPNQRARVFSVVAVATVVAPVLGPTLGGLITDHFSWRWVFFVNLPVGLLAAFMTAQVVEDPPHARADPAKARHVDYPGLGLIALGFGCLQVMLDRGEDDDWFGSPFIRVLALGALLGLAGAVLWLSVARNPVVDLRVYKNRSFAIGSVLLFLFAAILYSSAVLVPQLVQTHFGYTATLAGLILSPGAIVTAMLLPFVGLLLGRFQARYIVMFGFFILAIGNFLNSLINPGVNFGWLVTSRIELTLGIAFLFSPISVATTATLRPEQNTAGAALFTMARNLGGSVGISLATAMATNRTQINQAYLSEHLTPLNPNFATLVAQVQSGLLSLGRASSVLSSQASGWVYQQLLTQAAVMGNADVFRFLSIACLCAVPVAALLRGGVMRRATPGGH